MAWFKPIQIAVSPGDSHGPDVIYALCEDGSIWRLSVSFNERWGRLPDVSDKPPPERKREE